MVTIPFSGLILDGHGAANNKRYSNEQGIIAGGIFPLPTGSSGQINRYDMTRLEDADEDDSASGIVNFLVVNVTIEIQQIFGYHMLVADGCNSARDYGEVFNHGLFIGASAGINYYGDEITSFVTDLVDGQTDDMIFADLNEKT